MNPLGEENKNIPEDEEFSTIFTSSPTKTAAPAKKNGKMLKKILVSLLALVVLGGSIVAVKELIPEKEDEFFEETENIPVVPLAAEKVKSIKITRKNSVSTYLATVTEETDEETGEKVSKVTWTIAGIDPSLTETTAISMVTDTLLSLRATRTIEREEGADYGFSNPQYVIEITGLDAADNLTLTIGGATPSNSGVYAEMGGTIYLISEDAADDFGKTDEEMATSFAISAATVDADSLNYFTDTTLTGFDRITLSGKNFPSTLRFEMNKAEDDGNYNDYIMTSPCRRYADTTNVAALLEIASKGLTAAEAYKYNPTAADLKKYGLTAPELKLTIEFGGKKVELKACRYDDEYFAVLVTGKENIIFKVANSFLPFAEFEETAFANKLIFMDTISDFTNMTFKTQGATYSFGIDYTPETDEEKESYSITANGKEIKAENFQNFYQYLVIECNELTLKKQSGTPVLTVTAKGEKVNREIKFIKHSDRRYYVEVDSAPIGFISSTNMDKILDYLPKAAADIEVPAAV